MLSKDDVRYIRETIGHTAPPMLSLYVDVDPAKPENERKAWLTRAKESVHALGIPGVKHDPPLEEQVVALLEVERPPARTLALFATWERLNIYDLQVELPVVDLTHGRVDARWGDPYLTPLIYALDEYERAGVLWLNSEGWRFYEVFLGEIEEATATFREVSPEEWRELKKYDLAEHGGLLKVHTGSDKDHYGKRVESWLHRYYVHLGHLLEHVVGELEIQRLVLLGPKSNTVFFEQRLPRSTRNHVIAHVSDVPDVDASPGAVLNKVAPALEAAERAYEANLLDRIRSQEGVWGLDPTLDALQEGRLELLVAPWSLQADIWRCPNGWVTGTEEAVRILCPDGQREEVQEVALKDVIDDLVIDYGSGLEFVRGQAEQTLLDDLGGLAGLLRW